jgi:hypothetical protein
MSRVFAAAGASDEDDYFDDDFCEKDDDEEDEDGEKDGEKANEGTGDGEAWQAGEAGGLDAPPSSSFPLAQSSFLSQPQWLNENDEDKDDWDYKRANSLKIPTSQLDLAMLSEGLDAHSHESLDGRSMLGQVDASAANNRYYKLVADLSPNVVLQKFAASAAPNVQAAVKSTIVSILGSLPNYVLDTSLITTNTKLANLMFQMEVTGYMLKNAEYRMSLTRSLKGLPRLPPAAAVTVRAAKQSTGGNDNVVNQSEATVAAEKAVPQPQSEKTSEQQLVLPSDTTELTKLNMDGVVRVTGADGTQVEIEAKDLTAALVSEVSALRKELTSVRGEREGDLRGNLLTYVQALPERELAKLTTDMSDDVMEVELHHFGPSSLLPLSFFIFLSLVLSRKSLRRDHSKPDHCYCASAQI